MAKRCNRYEESLIQAMLVEDSQRKAYKVSIYKSDVMSNEQIDTEVHRVLNRPHVALRLEKLRAKIVAKSEAKAIFTVEGILTDLKELIDRNKENDDRVAMDGIKTAMKHLGILTDKVDIDATIKMPGIKITK